MSQNPMLMIAIIKTVTLTYSPGSSKSNLPDESRTQSQLFKQLYQKVYSVFSPEFSLPSQLYKDADLMPPRESTQVTH